MQITTRLSAFALSSPSCCGPEPAPPETTPDPVDEAELTLPEKIEAINLACDLMRSYVEGRLDLLPTNVSGVDDGADALSNVRDTAAGALAKRSSYGNAPGGHVRLSNALLSGLVDLNQDYTFRVTSLAGGSHSRRSRHYLGVALDVDTINGQRVNRNHPDYRAFMARARELGATEVLGPGHRGHDTHIHIAWPRNASKGS